MKSLRFSPEDVSQQPAPTAVAEERPGTTRRTMLGRIGLTAVALSAAGFAYSFLRSLVPNILYEPPRRFKIGSPDKFPEGATYLEDSRLFILRDQKTFQAMSAVCTHLGCTVKMITLNQPQTVDVRGKRFEEQREFHCPCHGSRYYGDGTNYAGPAPKPLARYHLEVTPEDGQLVVDAALIVDESFRLTV